MILELQSSLKLECKFMLVIKIEDKLNPAIYLEKDMINYASSINAEFDFDIYIN
jgi:hypothetical protein